MVSSRYRTLLCAVLLAGPACTVAAAPATEALIKERIGKLPELPDAKRPAAIAQLATDIRGLPAGQGKVKLADSLAHASTAGETGAEALQAVADALAQSLTETPQAAKNDNPAEPYVELAKLARYDRTSTDLKDPQLAKADEILAADDADRQKADFTLGDMNGKKYTLSALRGKIVLVNFWETTCGPCRIEMVNLDLIYTHYQSQGLIMLSITDEPSNSVVQFIQHTRNNYSPPILIDAGGKVAKLFHLDGLPRAFVFDREGKLVAQSIDMRTQAQFFDMLAKGGLHP